jgi:hypothetical protein
MGGMESLDARVDRSQDMDREREVVRLCDEAALQPSIELIARPFGEVETGP